MNKPLTFLDVASSFNQEIVIEVNNVSVFYGDFLAVRNLSGYLV